MGGGQFGADREPAHVAHQRMLQLYDAQRPDVSHPEHLQHVFRHAAADKTALVHHGQGPGIVAIETNLTENSCHFQ